jgi:GNAT superfamily N-acetyltransferase
VFMLFWKFNILNLLKMPLYNDNLMKERLNMNKPLIRRATQTDAKALSELIVENAAELLRSYYSDEQWEVFIKYYSVEILAEKISSQIIFVAESGNSIVGTIALNDDLVVGFYTRLDFVNNGIGSLLMRYLEDFALSEGIMTLQLASSPLGLTFYLRKGWQRVRDLSVDHYGVTFEETLMIKKLSDSGLPEIGFAQRGQLN